jgi:hypothetical protein
LGSEVAIDNIKVGYLAAWCFTNVVIQVSNDPTFATGVTTVFAVTDTVYADDGVTVVYNGGQVGCSVETQAQTGWNGRIGVDSVNDGLLTYSANGVSARYVRLTNSEGDNGGSFNVTTILELQVWSKGGASFADPEMKDTVKSIEAVAGEIAVLPGTTLEEVKAYWQKKVNVSYYTGNNEFDSYMRWVSFQPFLRRLYGCSFLPHHDYGRGGRGWRDLWQDCLSLLLMDPGDVRSMIVGNYGGVRIDGTNATIIGHKPGEFIADRNGISRVWMDHAFWPYLTTRLYMDQTGDLDVLMEKMPYFKDPLTLRGREVDQQWSDGYGNLQRTEGDVVYQGTILEHILVENLTAFYEVGEHNIIRLRGADWNDALDMANENG